MSAATAALWMTSLRPTELGDDGEDCFANLEELGAIVGHAVAGEFWGVAQRGGSRQSLIVDFEHALEPRDDEAAVHMAISAGNETEGRREFHAQGHEVVAELTD